MSSLSRTSSRSKKLDLQIGHDKDKDDRSNRVIEFISKTSFSGKEMEPWLYNALVSAVPELYDLIMRTEPQYRNIGMAYEAAEKHIQAADKLARFNGQAISKLKRINVAKLSFECALVLLNTSTDHSLSLYWNMEKLNAMYPEFNLIQFEYDKEIALLLNFRNVMAVALTLFPTAKHQKAHLLDIVTRLTEGYYMRYVCGTGEKPSTQRRVLIYERETGIVAGRRPPRVTDPVGGSKKKQKKLVEEKPPSKTKTVLAAQNAR